jgi:hypothetical protein
MSTMAQAKRDFGIGYLRSFTILRDVNDLSLASPGWNLDLEDMNGRRGFLVDARTKTVRVFKTLDAAVSALEEIGFQVNGLSK